MGELEKQISELLQKTANTRYQFLTAELQTCFTALEMAQFELSTGNLTVVERELGYVETGVRTLRRFLDETPGEQRREFETKLAELKAKLDALKSALNSQTR